MSFSFEVLRARIEQIARRIEEIGGEVKEVIIKDPATELKIQWVEKKLGVRLPESFKYVLLNFSAEFSFRWFFPKDYYLPGKYREIFGGTPNWSIDNLMRFEEDRRGWIDNVFPNPEDAYDQVWHNKLAFMEVGNGDYFAFDMSEDGKHPIIYLSHDDGEGHGHLIANDLVELLDHWSRLCFVGPEDWQWIMFAQSRDSGLLPESEAAIEFRSQLGITFP